MLLGFFSRELIRFFAFRKSKFMKKILDTKIISNADFHKPTYTCDPACFSGMQLATKTIFTSDLAKFTKSIMKFPKLHSLKRNTWRWLARLCHTHRFDSKKQQILFLSSAKKFYLEESIEGKSKLGLTSPFRQPRQYLTPTAWELRNIIF